MADCIMIVDRVPGVQAAAAAGMDVYVTDRSPGLIGLVNSRSRLH